jgi:hypothetical protein
MPRLSHSHSHSLLDASTLILAISLSLSSLIHRSQTNQSRFFRPATTHPINSLRLTNTVSQAFLFSRGTEMRGGSRSDIVKPGNALRGRFTFSSLRGVYLSSGMGAGGWSQLLSVWTCSSTFSCAAHASRSGSKGSPGNPRWHRSTSFTQLLSSLIPTSQSPRSQHRLARKAVPLVCPCSHGIITIPSPPVNRAQQPLCTAQPDSLAVQSQPVPLHRPIASHLPLDPALTFRDRSSKCEWPRVWLSAAIPHLLSSTIADL